MRARSQSRTRSAGSKFHAGAANALYGDVRRDSSSVVYYLYNRSKFPPIVQMTFELRTAGNPLTYVNAVREIVRRADPGVPVSDIKTQAAEIGALVDERTQAAQILGHGIE